MQANIRLKCPILTDVWVTSIFWSKVARKQKVSHGITRKRQKQRYGMNNKQKQKKNRAGNNLPQVQDSKVQME